MSSNADSSAAVTTIALIVGDIHALRDEAIRLLRELRYFVELSADVAGEVSTSSDSVTVAIDGADWRRALPDDLLTAPWLTVVTLEHVTDLPGVLANRAVAAVKTDWVSFCWPGTEISTWYANKAELLTGALVRNANIIAGYRGAGESRLQAIGSTESQLVHPDDGFSSDYPHAWLQMLDLVPMANALVKTDFVRRLGFTENALLQRCFWWDFTLRASEVTKIESLPLQPIPVESWHRYRFAAPLAALTDDAVRVMMGTLEKSIDWRSDSQWTQLSRSLQQKVQHARKVNGGAGLRITVLGGVNEPVHNQLCFFNYFALVKNWGLLSWRSIIDDIAHPDDLADSDLVIFSRVKSKNGVALMDFCNANNIATLYMLDDNWFWLGREWAEYAPLFTPGKPVFEQFMHCMKHADTVLTYNQHLADDLQPYVKNTNRLTLLPTNVALASFPRQPRVGSSNVTIGYVGSIRKNAQPFQALVEIAHARPAVKIFVMSNALPVELSVLPEGRVTFQPYQFSYAAYAKIVCKAAPDVLIAPVGSTRFEASKCPNKYLEITACGAAGVYSNTQPYTDYVRDGENGLLADDTVASWRTQIERLIDDAAVRHAIAEHALNDVKAKFETRAVLTPFLAMLVAAANVSNCRSPNTNPVRALRNYLRREVARLFK